MKRRDRHCLIKTVILTLMLIFASCGLAACSISGASPLESGEGSGSSVDVVIPAVPEFPDEEAESEVEDEPEVEPEPELPYDPIELCRDNPLVDADIASVELRLYGVGTAEIAGSYGDALMGILVNDARVWQDRSDWTFFTAHYLVSSSYPPHFVVTLESGEQLTVNAYETMGDPSYVLAIGDEHYALTEDEYNTFTALYEGYATYIIKRADTYVMPYADLTKDQLTKVTRVRHYHEPDQSEQVLDDEQLDLVLAALNELVIVPSVVDFTPEGLAGGGYEQYELWFENGDHYYVGGFTGYFDYSAAQESGYDYDDRETYPVAYIDGVVFRCNAEYCSDMYWNYEEMSSSYHKQYMSARNVPDHPFEEMEDNEITSIRVGSYVNGIWVQQTVPLTIKSEVADVLRSLLVTDDNKLEKKNLSIDEYMRRSEEITIVLNAYEQVFLGVDGDRAVINMSDYQEDPEVLAALKDLIELARDEAEKLKESWGTTQTVSTSDDEGSKRGSTPLFGMGPMGGSYTFELPKKLVKHDDGYYPSGYKLETAPISVEVRNYTPDAPDQNDLLSSLNSGSGPFGDDPFEEESYERPADAIVTRLEEEMAKAGSKGYYDTLETFDGVENVRVISHNGSGDYEREMLITDSGQRISFEIYIVQREDYDIGIDAIYALIAETLSNGSGMLF